MHKYLSMIAIVLSILLLTSCSNGTASTNSSETGLKTMQEQSKATETNDPTIKETESPTLNPSTTPSGSPDLKLNLNLGAPEYTQEESKEIFRNFLTENYQELHESSACGITGLGFIDLDLDGCIEMIAFDAGASAAMGVEIFDIVDNEVQCITTSIESINETFSSDNTTDTYINCNYFDDFRLMESKDGKEHFFVVNSGNGNAEFDYSELIRFGCNNGVLTLSKVAYKYTEYESTEPSDENSDQKIKLQKYEVNGKPATKDEYDNIIKDYNSSYNDTAFEAKGVFGWEKSEYSGDFDSFVKLMDEAFSLAEENQKFKSSDSDE